MKICFACKIEKSFSEFPKRKSSKDGYYSYCYDCNNQKRKGWYGRSSQERKDKLLKRRNNLTQRNRDYVYAILQQSKCIDCGYDIWQALEFDHVRGTKKHSICDMIRNTMALDKIAEEIAKCEIRCACCHRLKTGIQLGWHKSI